MICIFILQWWFDILYGKVPSLNGEAKSSNLLRFRCILYRDPSYKFKSKRLFKYEWDVDFIDFDFDVTTSKEDLHSGYSGIAPDPMMIAISVLNRIYDFKNQEVNEVFNSHVPQERIDECRVSL